MIKFATSSFRFGSMKSRIQSTLAQSLKPSHLQLLDESAGHSRGKETHFNAYIVSKEFEKLSKIQRHKLVYQKLGDLMGEFHALTLTCRTPDEQDQFLNQSPGCVHKKFVE